MVLKLSRYYYEKKSFWIRIIYISAYKNENRESRENREKKMSSNFQPYKCFEIFFEKLGFEVVFQIKSAPSILVRFSRDK